MNLDAATQAAPVIAPAAKPAPYAAPAGYIAPKAVVKTTNTDNRQEKLVNAIISNNPVYDTDKADAEHSYEDIIIEVAD